ncbi:MAG: hypothetical protein IKA36_04720 [Clostridia bacterium]|nr:hypothetical protein [Clostridia bacterium]
MDRREIEFNSKIAELQNRIAEQNDTIEKLTAIIEDYKSKEQSISNAIIASMEHANQLEASRKKLYSLDIQRSRLMYLRMEQIINELYRRYPELKNDTNLKDMSDKFRSMVFSDLNDRKNVLSVDVKPQVVTDDPIKKLLHNIIDCFETKKVDTERKTREIKSQTRPIPTTPSVMNSVSKSGFDFNEALNPTMGLDEIMKAFNINGDKDKKDKK